MCDDKEPQYVANQGDGVATESPVVEGSCNGFRLRAFVAEHSVGNDDHSGVNGKELIITKRNNN